MIKRPRPSASEIVALLNKKPKPAKSVIPTGVLEALSAGKKTQVVKPIQPLGAGGPDITRSDALREIFQEELVRTTIRRMRSRRETENEISHPLRALILCEREDALAKGLCVSVPSGNWSPSPTYVALVAKRSGTYRELAFPSIVDTIVGRRIIDTIESAITIDDNNQAFFGRSHANTTRTRGDYENWYKVWLDYSSQIGDALKGDGFTYVFDTDITQFFPSIDRERAKMALAQRTGAHQTVLELLFYCLDVWAPRVRYCAVPGLPIEPNDVSRLVAHNYLKAVDQHFTSNKELFYLRWVDDTVIFAKDERSALETKQKHHLALREVGLSPNASKTSIQSSADFAESRHPEFNGRIDSAVSGDDVTSLVNEWFSKSRENTKNWDKVATRIYSMAKRLKTDRLVERALGDFIATSSHSLQKSILRYLNQYVLPRLAVEQLTECYSNIKTSTETRIEIARFLCDVRIGDRDSIRAVVNLAKGQLLSRSPIKDSDYARALLLLALNKYADRAARTAVRNHFRIEQLSDSQLRLHYLYVFKCRGELDSHLENEARHLHTPDIAFAMQLCEDAIAGRLTKQEELLRECVIGVGGGRTVPAKYLPFVFAVARCNSTVDTTKKWLETVTAGTNGKKIVDGTVLEFLKHELHRIVS